MPKRLAAFVLFWACADAHTRAVGPVVYTVRTDLPIRLAMGDANHRYGVGRLMSPRLSVRLGGAVGIGTFAAVAHRASNARSQSRAVPDVASANGLVLVPPAVAQVVPLSTTAGGSLSGADSNACAATGVAVFVAAIVSRFVPKATGGPRGWSRDAAGATLSALTTALTAAVLATFASMPPVGAIVTLPRSQEQIEASVSRARALSAVPTFPLLSALQRIEALQADEATFRTCVTLGLPTGRLQMPPMLESGLFLNLELAAADPTALRAAAQAYTADALQANQYLAYAEAAQQQQEGAEISKYLDAAFLAVERCSASLQRALAAATK